MSVSKLLFEDLEVTGNAAAKPKTGYKRATPARAALKKEIADLKVSGLVVPKKHRTKREKKDTDSYEKSEPSKELGHNSAVTDLKRQSTDLHLSGKKEESVTQLAEQLGKIKNNFKCLRKMIEKQHNMEEYEEDINFIIANIGQTIAKSEKRRACAGSSKVTTPVSG